MILLKFFVRCSWDFGFKFRKLLKLGMPVNNLAQLSFTKETFLHTHRKSCQLPYTTTKGGKPNKCHEIVVRVYQKQQQLGGGRKSERRASKLKMMMEMYSGKFPKCNYSLFSFLSHSRTTEPKITVEQWEDNCELGIGSVSCVENVNVCTLVWWQNPVCHPIEKVRKDNST